MVLRDNPNVRPIMAQVAPSARISRIVLSEAALHTLASGIPNLLIRTIQDEFS
jgi:hypothetical protein